MPSLIFLLFKNFYISTQYKIDPSGSGDCITESKVGNVEPKDGAAAGKDGTEPPKVDTERGKVGTEPPKVNTERGKVGTERGKVDTEPGKVGTEPPKVATEPGKVDTEPPKVGREPGKVGTEPPKVDTERGKVGTEPPKIKESLRSIYLIALKRYCAFGVPQLQALLLLSTINEEQAMPVPYSRAHGIGRGLALPALPWAHHNFSHFLL